MYINNMQNAWFSACSVWSCVVLVTCSFIMLFEPCGPVLPCLVPFCPVLFHVPLRGSLRHADQICNFSVWSHAPSRGSLSCLDLHLSVLFHTASCEFTLLDEVTRSMRWVCAYLSSLPKSV